MGKLYKIKRDIRLRKRRWFSNTYGIIRKADGAWACRNRLRYKRLQCVEPMFFSGRNSPHGNFVRGLMVKERYFDGVGLTDTGACG